MPSVMCICEKCATSFVLIDNESVIASDINYHATARKSKDITKWSHWIEHLMNNCNNCRLQEVPDKAMQDYYTQLKKRK